MSELQTMVEEMVVVDWEMLRRQPINGESRPYNRTCHSSYWHCLALLNSHLQQEWEYFSTMTVVILCNVGRWIHLSAEIQEKIKLNLSALFSLNVPQHDRNIVSSSSSVQWMGCIALLASVLAMSTALLSMCACHALSGLAAARWTNMICWLQRIEERFGCSFNRLQRPAASDGYWSKVISGSKLAPNELWQTRTGCEGNRRHGKADLQRPLCRVSVFTGALA